MAATGDFIAGIGSGLGFTSPDDRGPGQFRALFPDWQTRSILDRIDSRSNRERRALVDRFRTQAGPLKLDVHEAAGFSEGGRIIAGIIEAAQPEFADAPHVVQHDHPDLEALELAKLIGPEKSLFTTSQDNPDAREQTINSYVGITVPSWGAADTATVLQITEPGRPRSTSLVPAIHIAVLRFENIVADLAELYAILHRDPPESSYVLITGPSKTADIESQLVHGAHGPREMQVVIVDDQNG